MVRADAVPLTLTQTPPIRERMHPAMASGAEPT
jgi:hypothetical protein